MRLTTNGMTILPLAFAALGLAACVLADTEAIDAPDKPALDLPAPTAAEIAAAVDVDIAPGEVAQLETEALDAPPASHPLASSYSGQSWLPLSTGNSYWATITLGVGENLDVRLIPYSGDADVYVYRSSSTIGVSARGSGYVDRVTTPPYASGYEGTYSLRFYCYSGPCSFGTVVAKGDDTALSTGTATYVNQRSFTTVSNKCWSGTKWLADGECYCSDASSAMQMANLGKIKIADARSAATDLFTNTNNSDGAANRTALMARLKSAYGYATCYEDTNTGNVKAHVRSGRLTLLRSPAFSTAGHYVSVRGFFVSSGKTYVEVDDPYGAWVSKGSWSPANTTATTSSYGQWRSYDLSQLSSGTLIVCY